MAKLDWLKKTLPFLGTIAGIALPGAAPIINIATSIVGAKLNKTIPSTAEGLAQALTDALGDPAQHAQLLAAEEATKEAMLQLGYKNEVDIQTLANADRDSARQREVQVKDNTPKVLAYLIIGSTLATCMFLVSHKSTILVNAEIAGFAGTVVGYLISEAKQVTAYYFGSSLGSDRKTEILAADNGK